MLSLSEARQRVRATIPTLSEEEVGIDAAAGRFLATAVVAARALPPWDNSAMDGFAVRAADVPGTLPVAGTVAAGDPPTARLAAGTALRIMTGAPLPTGADAVVMREDVDDRGETAAFAEAARVGQHVRRAGEDVAPGERVLEAGAALGPGEVGLLAALGHARVAVGRRPRVVLLSTGDELVPVEVEPGPGQIVNSNAYALAAQVREAGGEVVHAGIAADDRDVLIVRLRDALSLGDVLVTSGGVSVGDFDFVKEAFAAAGADMEFWKVAMKPGKPLAFGVAKGGVPVFGLPGNPVSSMVVFELFVRPSLLAMQGAQTTERPRAEVVLTAGYPKRPGRAHLVRAAVERVGGGLRATPNPRQGSGMLRSMIGVDALIELDAERGDVAAEETAPAWLLRAK